MFIEDYGCEECDGCHHGLLDVTDALETKIRPVVAELDTTAKSFYTTQKLKRLNEEAEELKPQIEKLDPQTNNLSEQIQEIDTLEGDSKNHQKKSNYLKQKANELNKASDELLKTVTEDKSDYRMVAANARNTINEVYSLADSLGDEDKTAHLDQAVRRAEEFLDQIKAFDPKTLFKTQPKEQTCKADTVFVDVERFAEPVNTQKKRLEQFVDATNEFNKKIDDLRDKSRDSHMNAHVAEKLNKKNKEARLPQKLDTITNFVKESTDNLKEGKSLELESKKLLSNLDLVLKDAKNLRTEMKDLNNNVDEILPKNEEDYRAISELLKEVANHALILTGKKENLENQYSNITANSNDAIKAANAYAEIENNVELGRDNSNSAHIASTQALKLTEGMGPRAAKSHQDSSELNHEGHSALSDVQISLSPNLQKSLDKVQNIKKDLGMAADKLKSINGSVDAIKADSLTAAWEDIQENAVDSNGLVMKSNKILEPIVEKLQHSSELSQKIPKDIEDANKDIANGLSQVHRIGETVPEILGEIDSLEEKQTRLDSLNSQIGDDLERLRKQVEQARALANSIKLGVNFMPNTTLELKPPENLQSQTFNTKLSTYFKTENPNGLLLYLGNEPKPGARGKRDDFMAIEIENGYPVLLIDVGDGPERVISNKRVDDGKWYEAIVERTGKNVKFTIRDEDNDGNDNLIEREEMLPGDQTNFNLDEKSRLFVGGYSDYQMPDSIKQSSFEGEIEGLKIGERDVGLWNFLDGQNNNLGSVERDRLVTKESKHTGYRFGGNGYVELDAKPYNFRHRSSISFKFKAARDSPDGLLFHVGHENHYLSIELRDGAIYFQFKLLQNSEIVEIKTANAFNDDEWHSVEATRDKGNGGLTVDGITLYQQTVYKEENSYEPPATMLFGGFPDRSPAKHFDGCIDDVHIDGTPLDLSRNIQSQDVLPGCPMKFSSVVAYAADKPGYLKSRNLTVSNKLHINLKFKTLRSKGVIFFGMNNDQSATISLALDEGVLVFRSSKFELNTDTKKFNDGQWHVVTATHDERKLRLFIDDTFEYRSEEQPPALVISFGDIYFGGLPKNFRPVHGAISNEAYFVGCIQDVTINTNVINFASSTDKLNAIMNSCPRDILEYNTDEISYYFPDGRIEKPVLKSEIDVDTDSRFQKPDENEISNEEDDNNFATPAPTTQQPTTPAPTKETTTTPKPKPIYTEDQKNPLCVLPVIPDYDVDFDSAGYRFGTSPNTFVELESAPESTKNAFEFSLTFKTPRQNGLLFLAADSQRLNTVSLSLKDGYLYYEIMCSGSKIPLTSKSQYDDNAWHTVEFSRKRKQLTLKIGNDEHFDNIPNKCLMELRPSYLIGGSNEKSENGNQFFGCIKEVKLGGQLIKSSSPPSEGVLPCSENIETGIFFGKSGGYIKLRDKFKVGSDLTISMDIKPRNRTGVLTSVHGKKSFFIVEMLDGNVVFTVDSGDGPRETKFVPDSDKSLCDGEWHTGLLKRFKL